MGTLANVSLGAATVSLGGVDVGHTWGGAVVTIDRKFVDLNVDFYGTMPIDRVLTGQTLEVEVTMAEVQAHNIAASIPEATDFIGSLHEKVAIGSPIGTKLSQYAKQLILHPVDRPVNDLTQDVVIYNAVAGDPIVLNYQFDKQRLFKMKFYGLVSEAHGTGFRLGQIGQDPVS
jgi:hypothetical protein